MTDAERAEPVNALRNRTARVTGNTACRTAAMNAMHICAPH